MNWQFNNGSLIKTKKLWSDFICKFKIRKSLSQVMEFTLLRTTNKELHKPENQALTEQCCFKLLIEHLFHLASFSSPLIEVNGIWNKGTNFSKLPARSTWLKKKRIDNYFLFERRMQFICLKNGILYCQNRSIVKSSSYRFLVAFFKGNHFFVPDSVIWDVQIIRHVRYDTSQQMYLKFHAFRKKNQ